MSKEPRKHRVPIILSDEELTALDEWRFDNKISARSDAIHRLIELSAKKEGGHIVECIIKSTTGQPLYTHSLFESEANPKRAAVIAALRKGVDLSGANLDAIDLHGVDFSGAILRGVHFYFSNLKDADFSKADLRGAIFFCARLYDAKFFCADLRNANFTDVYITGADFGKADLQGAKFFIPDFRDAKFDHSILRDTVFELNDFG